MDREFGSMFSASFLPCVPIVWHASPFLQPEQFHASCEHKYSHCRNVFCNFPFLSLRGSIDESPVEWSGQQNPQGSHAAEQTMASHAESKSPLALGEQLCVPFLLGDLFEQHPTKLGTLLSAFCFSFKLIYRLCAGKDLNSYSTSDLLALAVVF